MISKFFLFKYKIWLFINIIILIFIINYLLFFSFNDILLKPIQIKDKLRSTQNYFFNITNIIKQDIDDYKEKLKFKKELFNVGVPIFESIELTAKALERICVYKEFLEKRKNYHKNKK